MFMADQSHLPKYLLEAIEKTVRLRVLVQQQTAVFMENFSRLVPELGTQRMCIHVCVDMCVDMCSDMCAAEEFCGPVQMWTRVTALMWTELKRRKRHSPNLVCASTPPLCPRTLRELAYRHGYRHV